MTKRRVKLAWISNDNARKTSFKKRRDSLFKKMSEISILCGIDVFGIIYSPYNKELMVWPSCLEVHQQLMRFMSMPGSERNKKMTTLDDFLKERINKVNKQCQKEQRKHQDMELSYFMHIIDQGNGINDLNLAEMNRLDGLVQARIKEIKESIEHFHQVLPLLLAAFTPQDLNVEEIGQTVDITSGDESNPAYNVGDQWFNNIINYSGKIASSSNTKGDISFGGRFDMGTHLGNVTDTNVGKVAGLRMPHNDGGNIVGIDLPINNVNENVAGFRQSQEDIGGNVVGLGLPQGNIIGSSDENASTAELDQNSLGLPEFYEDDSDFGLPYDITKPWTYNF